MFFEWFDTRMVCPRLLIFSWQWHRNNVQTILFVCSGKRKKKGVLQSGRSRKKRGETREITGRDRSKNTSVKLVFSKGQKRMFLVRPLVSWRPFQNRGGGGDPKDKAYLTGL